MHRDRNYFINTKTLMQGCFVPSMIKIHQVVHEKRLSIHFHVDAVIHYDLLGCSRAEFFHILTLLHSERPKLHTILAYLSAVGLKRHSCKAASYQVCQNPSILS